MNEQLLYTKIYRDLQVRGKDRSPRGMLTKELENYLTGIFKFFQINEWNPDLNDVHFDNVGVLMPSDPTVVVFDY